VECPPVSRRHGQSNTDTTHQMLVELSYRWKKKNYEGRIR